MNKITLDPPPLPESANAVLYAPSYRHGSQAGAETLTVNLVVSDADAVYEKVRAYGGEILLDIEDKHYGGRGFTCRDLEGHIWNVGTYDPWQPK